MTIIFSGVLAILFAALAILGRKEKLPMNAFYGFRTASTMSSEGAWIAAHRAAAPANALAALSFGLTAIVAGSAESPRGESVSAIVGWIIGFLAMGIAIFTAQRAAAEVLPTD